MRPRIRIEQLGREVRLCLTLDSAKTAKEISDYLHMQLRSGKLQLNLTLQRPRQPKERHLQ
jgi:hypothetical protein